MLLIIFLHFLIKPKFVIFRFDSPIDGLQQLRMPGIIMSTTTVIHCLLYITRKTYSILVGSTAFQRLLRMEVITVDDLVYLGTCLVASFLTLHTARSSSKAYFLVSFSLVGLAIFPLLLIVTIHLSAMEELMAFFNEVKTATMVKVLDKLDLLVGVVLLAVFVVSLRQFANIWVKNCGAGRQNAREIEAEQHSSSVSCIDVFQKAGSF